MERAFGQSFGDVKVALGRGPELAALDAHAAASGEGIAFADRAPSKEVVAHELTHVVQHRRNTLPPATIHRDAADRWVQAAVNKDYEDYVETFEIKLGNFFATQSLVTTTADQMLAKVRKLVEIEAGIAGTELEKAYEATFGGGKHGKQSTGGIGTDVSFIKEAFDAGNFREKMTLIYQAICNSQNKTGLNQLMQKVVADAKGEMADKAVKAGVVDPAHVQKLARDSTNPSEDDFLKEQPGTPLKLSKDARVSQPLPRRRTTQSAADVEAEGGIPLSSRELATQFDAPRPAGSEEERRAKLMAAHGKERLEWQPGLNYFWTKVEHEFSREAAQWRKPIGAAISGSTDRFMKVAAFLGEPAINVRAAALGWMLPARDHTFHEIMTAAAMHGVPYERKDEHAYEHVAPIIVNSSPTVPGTPHWPSYYLSNEYKAHKRGQMMWRGVHLKSAVSQPGDAAEREADAVARQVVAGQRVTVRGAALDADVHLMRREGKEIDDLVATGVPRHHLELLDDEAWGAFLAMDKMVAARESFAKITADPAFAKVAAASDRRRAEMDLTALFKRHGREGELDKRTTALLRAAEVMHPSFTIEDPSGYIKVKGGGLKAPAYADITIGAAEEQVKKQVAKIGAGNLFPDITPAFAEKVLKLPAQEKAALVKYANEKYAEWNPALHGKKPDKNPDKILMDQHVELRAAVSGLHHLPVYEGTVWRGEAKSKAAATKKLKEYQIGTTIGFDDFMSTSTAPDTKYVQDGFVVLMITQVKTGRDMRLISDKDTEKEVLFAPGSRFTVVSVGQDTRFPGKTVVELKEL